jgi:hypothetical protein
MGGGHRFAKWMWVLAVYFMLGQAAYQLAAPHFLL